MADQHLSFGLLMTPAFQLLDAVGPMDYINSHSKQYLELVNAPAELSAKAPSMEWHHISHSLEPFKASAGPLLLPTTTYATCPKLDYLIIPGPDPMKPLPEGCAAWLKERFENELKGLLLVCTGSLAVAASLDILDGLNVATNKVVLKMVAPTPFYEKVRKVKWVGDKRWVIDGKVWSGAGVTAGIDLAAEFVKRTFDPDVVEMARVLLEYTGKPDAPDDFAFVLEGVAL